MSGDVRDVDIKQSVLDLQASEISVRAMPSPTKLNYQRGAFVTLEYKAFGGNQINYETICDSSAQFSST